MALADTFDRLPPWALYGGAGLAAGGGYFLYRRRRQQQAGAGAGAAQATTASSPATSSLDYGASAQQPSIVPYYLTSGQGQGSYGGGRRSVPTPTGASVPGGSAATGTGAAGPAGGVLPDIPPILPVSPTPPPPAPSIAGPTPAPAPAPAPGPVNLPADLLAQIRSNGENIIGNLIDPVTGGTWWFGSKGGVFAVNGARFLGSVPSVGASFPGFTAVQAIPVGSGYRIVNSAGQAYNFNG